MKNTGNLLKALYIINTGLILILAGSFLFSGKNSSLPKKETVLLKPEEKENTASVTIKDRISSVTLTNSGHGIWIGKTENSKEIWPCDTETVNLLLKNLTNIIKVYKFSDNKALRSDYSLSEEDALRITLSASDGKVLSELFFGTVEKLTNRIYFCTGSSDSIWCTDDSYSVYLTSDPEFWCDRKIQPDILYYDDFSKADSFLQRGKLLKTDENLTYERSLVKIINGSRITLRLLQKGEKYKVYPLFTPYDKSLEQIFSAINYGYELSSYTYSKLKETGFEEINTK
ncbi:MAG: DUF4340 domain-containing protein [Treponema sp.]|nr:DUF4340 domain-containing protein [Treponema sp.]